MLRPLGDQLRRLRRDRDLTQEKLAELSGLNYKYIGRIELAKAEPGADVLVRLARALMVPVGALFETITPTSSDSRRVSPTDVRDLSEALTVLSAAVDRIVTGQALPPRTKRRSRSR